MRVILLCYCIQTDSYIRLRVENINCNYSFHRGRLCAFELSQCDARRVDIPTLSSPIIACLAIVDCTKLNCRHQDTGYEPNSCCSLAFVNFPDILRNVDDSKGSEISRNQTEIPQDVTPYNNYYSPAGSKPG